jgi:hypothetical protein
MMKELPLVIPQINCEKLQEDINERQLLYLLHGSRI